ncbi:uncharacterized protein LOC108154836 isoform X1 [Drosophila miranda]|uniref:uncharacterized protein LOC108154836 isoform X1 n=1 Tax=Drosophila miranda TaxID=7229 RepID=UPI0007E85F7A|nr:uncharacterized protein LOC108154836 isoform X1 [Drosophila miranda]
MTPKKREKTNVWIYYVNNTESGLATCRMCNGTLKNNRVSNLKTHLWNRHKIKVLKITPIETKVDESSDLDSEISEKIIHKQKRTVVNKKQTLRQKRNALWKYFENNIDSGLAKCKICKAPLRNRVSNLKGHLFQQHDINLYYAKRQPMKKIRVNVNNLLLRNNKNDVWNYYENIIDSGIARCKTCNGTLKNNRVSNLKTHLLKMHNLNLSVKKIQPIESASSEADSVHSVKIIPKEILKINVNRKQLLRSFIGLVTEDCIPLKVLDSPNMRNIIGPICDGLEAAAEKPMSLNGSSCIKHLELVASNIRLDIKTELKNKLLSFRIDSASRLCRNIVGISAQFLRDAQIKSRFLGMIELRKEPLKNVAVEVINVLKRYDIKVAQMVSATSDNGEPIEESGDDCSNEEYLKKIELVEKSPNILLGHIRVSRCAAHSAQLCVLDVTKSSEIINYIFTCRNLTKYIRKPSNRYHETFEQKQLKMPQLDCPTRWGSTYAMLEHLKLAKDVIPKNESVRSNIQDGSYVIDSFWEFIESYCVVFGPLQKTILKFEEEQLHYGNFYAQWLKCKICTEKIVKDASQTLTTTIGNIILNSIDKRTTKFMNSKRLVSCLYLDPRFHHTLTAEQKVQARDYLKQIWDRITELNPEVTSCSASMVSIPDQSVDFDEEDELLNQYLTQGLLEANVGSKSDVYTKIETLQLPFQRIDVDVLSFWQAKENSDQELYAISKVCFAIPPTQVAMERQFSTLRLMLTDDWNQHGQETLENIFLVKLNPNFLESAIDQLPIFQNDQNSPIESIKDE